MISKCGECGGKVDLIARAGRVAKYKGKNVIIPADHEIPTCVGCGEEYLNGEGCSALDAVLEKVIKCRWCWSDFPNETCDRPAEGGSMCAAHQKVYDDLCEAEVEDPELDALPPHPELHMEDGDEA